MNIIEHTEQQTTFVLRFDQWKVRVYNGSTFLVVMDGIKATRKLQRGGRVSLFPCAEQL